MSEPTLSIDGTRATIQLNRPEKRNRIEPPDLTALDEHLQRIDADESVRVAIITATGPSFCSGYHLGALGERSQRETALRPEADFGSVCDRIEDLRVPVIARCNGSIHGGGTDLALACDFRIGVIGSQFGMPAARIGLQYYPTGIRRYVTRLGPDAAKRLFLTAIPVDSDTMVSMGILHEAVEADELDTTVERYAGAIESLAPMAIRNMKAAINAFARGDADLEHIAAGAKATMASEDHREGIRALRENRPPRFVGR